VAVTLFVAVLITDTVFEFKFATYANAPFGVMATPTGKPPTGIVATTLLLVVEITETELEPNIHPELVTYAKAPLGVMATARG
jgi:hypothetical protein